jgi:hypothetical protein
MGIVSIECGCVDMSISKDVGYGCSYLYIIKYCIKNVNKWYNK